MRERFECQRGEVGPQLVVDEVDFVRIPRIARRFLARLELFARAEGDVADENTAVLLQKRQEIAKKVDFLRVRQMMERVGRDDGVVLAAAKRRDEPFGKSS